MGTFQRMDVYHMGMIVDDVPAAVETWSKVYGAGPFYYFRNSNHDELRFYGEPVKFTETSAYGKLGRFAIELQSFDFETPIPELQEILGTHPNTVNHIGFLAQDSAAASARLEALGLPLFLYGSVAGNVFYWHDARRELGHFVEVFTDRAPVRVFHEMVAREAAEWDGNEPLRTTLPPELQAEFGRLMNGG